MLLMWLRVFYWLRLFTGTSFYMRLIRQTIFDLRFFLFILITFLLMFANVMLILDMGRGQGNSIFAESHRLGAGPFFEALLDQYLLGLGDFAFSERFDGENGWALWIFFCLATFMTQITIVNMLIAVMSDTYDKVSEKKDQATLQEKIKILADYVWVVGMERNLEDRSSYIFVARPKAVAEDEEQDWQGKVTAIRSCVDRNTKSVKDHVKRNAYTLHGEIADTAAKVKTVEQKVDGLQGTV